MWQSFFFDILHIEKAKENGVAHEVGFLILLNLRKRLLFERSDALPSRVENHIMVFLDSPPAGGSLEE
ncbi:hypothetical protein A2Z00_04260 [Candidatus Gottesmanbacteria bacterium RBG_13_45_10]|uniref:Uncharacterized protein n=1 Tax=Candidatus Gottesmanbacteria bacterium RBG_13_45_10 TaxID=1798370 RepID=A0A1F5ZIG5_9BACT|nr:MAG: hypothetical protein A2Z00_04260 [Candidatus Gottesmanbacteria bacterium RBG_13_45_10]